MAWWILGFVLMSLVVILGLLSQSAVLYVIFTTPSLRHTLSNFYVISLTVCGVLTTAIVMPSAVYVFVSSNTEDLVFGQSFCDVFQSLHSFGVCCSALGAAVIAIERRCSIVTPMFHAASMTLIRTVSINCIIWMISIIFSVLHLIRDRTADPCLYLYTSKTTSSAVQIVSIIVTWICPYITLVAMYANIFYVARRAQKQVQPVPTSLVASPEQLGSNIMTIWTVGYVKNQPKPRKKSNKALRTLLLIVGVYTILWSPYWIYNIVLCFCDPLPEDPVYGKDYAALATTWLLYFSICLNGLLYGILNRAVRMEILRRFGKYWRTCKKYTKWKKKEVKETSVPNPEAVEDFWQFLERTSPSSPVF